MCTARLVCIILFPIFPLACFAQAKKAPEAKKPASDEWTLRARLIGKPHNKDAHTALCEVLKKQNKYRDLADERVAWLADNPNDSGEVISLDTEAYFWLNDDEVAISATRKYLAALAADDPMYGWANNFLGRELMRRRKYSEAVPYLKK